MYYKLAINNFLVEVMLGSRCEAMALCQGPVSKAARIISTFSQVPRPLPATLKMNSPRANLLYYF